MKDWDDARVFVALAQHGTTRKAADALGMHQSTVSRRLGQVEADSGLKLFERAGSGLVLTEVGAALLPIARRIEDDFRQLQRHALGRDARLSGHVRVSVPEFAVALMGPALASFAAAHPAIVIELIVDTRIVDLTHREADVALRLVDSPPDHLVGRRIARARMGVYAARTASTDCTAATGQPLVRRDWIRWDEPFRSAPTERWINTHVPADRVRARINTSSAAAELIARGVGVGFLLRCTGDADPRLVRIAEPEDFGFSLWLLTHGDLRNAARIRAFMQHVGRDLAGLRARFEGENAPLGEPVSERK